MKSALYGSLFALFFYANIAGAAGLPDLDDSDVRDSVDIRAFEIGDDGDVGVIYYIVDRTTSNCFLLARDKFPGGIAPVQCDSLKAIPLIKQYLETGEIAKKKTQ